MDVISILQNRVPTHKHVSVFRTLNEKGILIEWVVIFLMKTNHPKGCYFYWVSRSLMYAILIL